MTDRKFVVWYRYLGKLCPQVWTYKPASKSVESSLSRLEAVYELPKEDHQLGLDAIAEKYPYKERAD